MKKNIAIGCLLVVFVAMNAWLLFRNRVSTSKRKDASVSVQEQLRTKWNSDASVGLDSSRIVSEVQALPEGECFSAPSDVETVKLMALPREQTEDLMQLITKLLTLYSENSVDGILSLMDALGEKLDMDKRDIMIKGLVKTHKMSLTDVKNMSDRKLVNVFAEKYNYNPHWQAIVPKSSCVQLYRMRTREQLDADLFARSDLDIWHNMASYHHAFRPTRTADVELNSRGEVLVADLRLVIRHDSSALNVVVPYYFRFWYDSQGKHWHPVQARVITSDMASYMRILF